MNHYKLIRVLQLLSTKEFSDLILFSSYELFCKNKKVHLLLVELEKQYPEFNFNKKDCFSSVFSNEKFDDLRLR